MPDLAELLAGAPSPDLLARQAVAQRAARSLRPPGSLARLDEAAAWLASWQRTDCPSVERPAVLLAAGDHGVVRRGVTAWPEAVTAAVVDAARAGVATCTVMAETVGAVVRLVDAGVGRPVGDISVEPALDRDRFDQLVALGRRHVEEMECDLLVLGEVGMGNTTAAAALSAVLYGGDVGDWVGPGAGLDEEGMERKRRVVEDVRERVGRVEPLEALRQVGGAELVVLAAACVEARLRSIPVLLDGYASTAAVAPLAEAVVGALDHCLAAHLSAEPGHRLLLDRLGKDPLLHLDMALGEGTGGILAIPVLRLAARAVVDVVTLEEWGLA